MAPGLCNKPGAGPATILSPDEGHRAACGRADVGHALAPLGGLSRGGAVGPAAVSSAAACWCGWSAAGVYRGLSVAAGAPADALALVLSRGLCLVVRLAGLSPGTSAPTRPAWAA